MAFDERLTDAAREAAIFNEIISDFAGPPEGDLLTCLMLDSSEQIHRLARLRELSIDSWFDYHRVLYGGERLEVVIADRFDPADGEKQTRVITKAAQEHEKGDHITVTDNFVAPLSSRFVHERGDLLILKNAKRWPFGRYGRPVIKPMGDWVHLLGGPDYDHYPQLSTVEPEDVKSIQKLEWLVGLLGDLDAVTRQLGYRPGTGEF